MHNFIGFFVIFLCCIAWSIDSPELGNNPLRTPPQNAAPWANNIEIIQAPVRAARAAQAPRQPASETPPQYRLPAVNRNLFDPPYNANPNPGPLQKAQKYINFNNSILFSAAAATVTKKNTNGGSFIQKDKENKLPKRGRKRKLLEISNSCSTTDSDESATTKRHKLTAKKRKKGCEKPSTDTSDSFSSDDNQPSYQRQTSTPEYLGYRQAYTLATSLNPKC